MAEPRFSAPDVKLPREKTLDDHLCCPEFSFFDRRFYRQNVSNHEV